jgi:hypothetical protein
MRRHTCRGVCVPSGTKNSQNDVDLVNSSGKSPGECVVLHQFIVPHFDIFIQNEMNMLRGYAVAAACLAATVATAAAFTAGGEWWTLEIAALLTLGVFPCHFLYLRSSIVLVRTFSIILRFQTPMNLAAEADFSGICHSLLYSGNMIFLSR